MRISSSVGPGIAAAATEDLVLRAPFFEGATFLYFVDARRGLTLSILASGDEVVSNVARFSLGKIFVFLATN
jgi:hypothetical protein